MILMQKIKFMQEFTSAINVECLPSILQARLLMHNCAGAKKMQKRFCSMSSNLKSSVVWKISAYDAHIQEQ